ncbi:MAG: carboxypeptidase-like regulatory domain-containing protein, partial [Planctomycetota bacterium]
MLTPERETVAASTGEPAPRLRVRGLVTTLSGTPLADANIHALAQDSGGVGPVLARSAADGTFELEAPPESLIVARKSGYQPSGSRGGKAQLPTRSVQPVVVGLRMGADGHALAGRVVGANGEPAAGAHIAVCVDEDAREQPEGMPVARERKGEKPLDREILVLVADEAGRFSSDEVPAGAATLLARSAAGDAIGWSECVVRPGEENRAELRLGAGAALSGRAHTTLPTGSLTIHAEWSGELSLGALDDHGWGPLFSDRVGPSRADGGFAFDGLFPGRYTVRVRCGPLELAKERVELLAGEQRTLDFDLPAAVATRVRVLGPGREPLAGWGLLWTAGGSFDVERAREQELPLELDGSCELVLEPVEHAFALHAPTKDPRRRNGFEALPRAIRRGVWPTTSEILWQITEAELVGGSVHGRWLDEHGLPLAAHEIRMQSIGESSGTVTTRTDEAGHFSLVGLPAGEFMLTANERGLPRVELARLALAAGETRDLGD